MESVEPAGGGARPAFGQGAFDQGGFVDFAEDFVDGGAREVAGDAEGFDGAADALAAAAFQPHRRSGAGQRDAAIVRARVRLSGASTAASIDSSSNSRRASRSRT